MIYIIKVIDYLSYLENKIVENRELRKGDCVINRNIGILCTFMRFLIKGFIGLKLYIKVKIYDLHRYVLWLQAYRIHDQA